MAKMDREVNGVRGWMTVDERDELSRLARDKVVLEVGSYCGMSASVMAPVARKFTCVDNFAGVDESDSAAGLREEFFGNLDRLQLTERVSACVGRLEEIIPQLNLARTELVFYDADHSYDSTYNGVQLLLQSGLPATATIAFHDYDSFDPGVVKAVDRFASSTGRTFRLIDTLAVFDGVEQQATRKRYNVMLAVPHNGTITYQTAQAIFRASSNHDVVVKQIGGSLLASNFNQLLCAGLQMEAAGAITHMAMIHSDIDPEDCWLDTLIEEMEAQQADLVSAVVAIKDLRGVTSTAIGQLDDPWHVYRRLTVKESLDLPQTFDSAGAGCPGKPLLVNSGLWVADLRRPCFKAVGDDGVLRAHFTIRDRIVKQEDGTLRVDCEPEDWYFSRQLHELGARVCATHRVLVKHIGPIGFTNDQNWGFYQEGDLDTKQIWSPPEQSEAR